MKRVSHNIVKSRFFLLVILISILNTASANLHSNLNNHINPHLNPINQIKQQWAIAKYDTPHDKQLEVIGRLVNEAEDLYVRDRHNAEAVLWYGISLATYASFNEGLFSTIHHKAACSHLEESLALNPHAEHGLAHTILGVLYQKTDQAKADNHFKMALNSDPNGLESNYYYGAFLIEKGHKQEAKAYLEKALKSASQSENELADHAQRTQVSELIEKIS